LRITYNSYGSGSKPLFLGSASENAPANWTSLGGNLWSAGGQLGGNLFLNPSFATNLSNWSLVLGGTAAATFTQDATSYHTSPASAALAVSNQGTQDINILLQSNPFSVAKGKTYRLGFYAKASTAFSMSLPFLSQQTNLATKYYSSTTAWTGNISTSWTYIQVDYECIADATDAILAFRFGHVIPNGTTFNIDDVSIQTIDNTLRKDVGNVNFNNPSYVTNASFTTDTSGWILGANAADGASATLSRNTSVYNSAPAAAAISVVSTGASNADIQLEVPNLSVTNGFTYQLTFSAKSTAAFTMTRPSIIKQTSPYTNYSSSTSSFSGAITTSWQTFTITYVANANANDAAINIFLGASLPAGATLYMDDVNLKQVYTNLSFDSTLQNANMGFKKLTLAEVTAQGDFWHDDANYNIVMYSSANPATLHATVECALYQDMVELSSKSCVTIDGLSLWNGGAQGVSMSSVSDVTVSNCDLRFIGGGLGSPGVRLGNAIQFWNNASNCLVTNNYISNIYDAGVTNQGSGADGNRQSNLSYTYNTILACHYSFELWDRPATSEMSDITFSNNTCWDAGTTFSESQRPDPARVAHVLLSYSQASATNITITHNIFAESTINLVNQNNGEFTDLANVTLDYNTYNQSAGGFAAWYYPASGTSVYYTIAQFAAYQSATGKDAHSTLSP
jgi:fructose-specific component phosphotransferase system IIB-like protein